MNIVELVKYLKNISIAENLIRTSVPDIEYDVVDLYMENKLGLESEIVFFDATKIPNKLIIDINGVQYKNLFPLYLAQEMVQEYDKFNNYKLSDLEIAKKLLEYRLKDA